MKAIILAAGRGSRLGALTDEKPKCLMELAGRPLLSWQIAALRAAGVGEIVVVGGYRMDRLPRGDFTLLENPRWATTNMMATLGCAAEHLRAEPVLVSYSDIVYHPATVEALMAAPGDVAITYDRLWSDLWRRRFADPLADAESFVIRDGLVQTIGERAERIEQIEGQYMGLLKFTPHGWRAVEKARATLSPSQRDRLDATGLLRLLVRRGTPVHAVPVDGRWCEVDGETDLRLYESLLGATPAAPAWSHDWRWVA